MKNLLLPVVSCLFACAAPLAAQTLDDVVSIEVLPGWTTSSGSQMAGLRINLAPGWKTYWRAPGDAGIPPIFDYDGSENVGSVRVQWPVPDVFHQNGMRSIGYHDQVVLPLELTRSAGGDMRFAGTLSLGICEEICVPAHLNFDGILPEGGDRDPLIVAALVDRPLRADEAGVEAAFCSVSPAEHGLAVQATVMMPPAGAEEQVVIEAGDPQVWVSEPTVSRSGDALTAEVVMAHVTGEGFALDRSAVRITVLGSDHAVDIRGCQAG